MFSVSRWCIYLLAGLCLVGKAMAQFGDIDELPSDFSDADYFVPFPGVSWLKMKYPDNLPFDTEFSLRGGYDTNVETSSVDPLASPYAQTSLGIIYNFGSKRLKVLTKASGGITYYVSRPGRKQDYNFNSVIAASYVANRRLAFNFSNSIVYAAQPDFFIPGTDAQRVGDYLYTDTGLNMTVTLRPRLSAITAYSINTLNYQEPELNDASGRITQNISQAFNFLLTPVTIGLVEFRVNPVTYYVADLNTVGAFLVTGFEHKFNPRLFWNLRTGLETRLEQNQTDGRGMYVGPYLESTFGYNLGERTAAGLTLSYSSEPSGIGGVTIRQTFRTGLNLSYAFTQRLSATLDALYQYNFYDQPDVIPDIREQIFSASFGLRFQINRNISLSAAYQYIQDMAPDAPGLEYTKNSIFGGINFAF